NGVGRDLETGSECAARDLLDVAARSEDQTGVVRVVGVGGLEMGAARAESAVGVELDGPEGEEVVRAGGADRSTTKGLGEGVWIAVPVSVHPDLQAAFTSEAQVHIDDSARDPHLVDGRQALRDEEILSPEDRLLDLKFGRSRDRALDEVFRPID